MRCREKCTRCGQASCPGRNPYLLAPTVGRYRCERLARAALRHALEKAGAVYGRVARYLDAAGTAEELIQLIGTLILERSPRINLTGGEAEVLMAIFGRAMGIPGARWFSPRSAGGVFRAEVAAS